MSLVVRIAAPTGRDAELSAAVLRQNGIAAEPCRDLVCLLAQNAEHPIGPLLVAEEALDQVTMAALIDAVRRQPPWSDLPILILTGSSHSSPRGAEGRFEQLGSPVLLERPLRPDTLVSSIRAALRARQRQYEIRDTLGERDRALAALRNEQETLKVVMDNMPVGIIVAGRSGQIILANRRAEQMIGRPLPPTAGNTSDAVWEVFHPDGHRLQGQEYPLWRAMNSMEPVAPEEYLYRCADGSMSWIRMVAAPIIDPEGSVSGGIAALTEIDMEKRAEAALMKSEKLAAVGRMAASISHEINNPLAAVTNLLYLVEQNTRGSDASQFAAKAQEELARVSQIVTQTLRFHRQSTNPQLVAIKDLLESTVGLYRGRIANWNIHLEFQDRAPDPIVCREGDIRQVLNNLVGNAIDAMRGGGRLVIRTSRAHHPQTGAPGIRVSIADTGHGIAKDTMKHIFEPFYTTKGESGSGLGLWISQEIVVRNKGRLHIRSVNGGGRGGTIASVFLPEKIE